MKSVKIMFLALGLIAMISAVGFAQTSMTTTFSDIQVSPNAQTGAVGEVDFVPLVPGTIPAGESITLTYGAAISSVSDLNVIVAGCPAAFTFAGYGPVSQNCPTANTVVTVTVLNTTATTGTVTIGVSGPVGTAVPLPTPQNQQFIRIFGVRLNIAAMSLAPGALINATATNSVGVGTITNNVVPVATVTEPLVLTAPPFGPFPQTGNTTVTSTLTITELFNNAFETKGATNPTQIIVTATPPTGFTLDTSSLRYVLPVTLATDAGTIAQLVSVSGNVFTIVINSQNANAIDNIQLPLWVASGPGPISLTPGSVAVTATLAPPAVGVQPYAVGVTLGPLRYAVRNATLSIALSTTQLTTILYSTFNVYVPPAPGVLGFNTGFAIANGSGILSNNGAQLGAITVTLYPADGSKSQSFTTSASTKPGLGLDANGMLPAGAEWTVLLSDILKVLTTPLASFQGQMVFTAKFSDGHGVNFIADPAFAVQSQGYEMLVISGLGYVH